MSEKEKEGVLLHVFTMSLVVIYNRLFCRWCAILRSEDAAEEQEEERTKVAADINSPENEGLALLDAIGVDVEYLSPQKPQSKSPSPSPNTGRASPATEPISPEDVDFASPQYRK